MRLYKVFELVGLFVLIPLLFYFDFIPGPKAIPLLVVFLVALIYLLFSRKFNRKEFGFNGYSGWRWLLLRMFIATCVVYILTIIFIPDRLFYLPKNNLHLWIAIMIFYPIWSAFTQELIYRSFFFYRYKSIFNNEKLMVLFNGILFGFLHIIFRNWIAVVCTMLVGFYWASSYSKHRSLMLDFVEHAFVGNLLYNFGIGSYFYVPDF